MNKLNLATLLILLIVCSCQPPKENKIAESFDTFFADKFKADEPGAAVLIVKDNEVAFSKCYGLADLKTGEPITSKTLFNTGSISKTFVSNVILSLAEEKKLSLDDPLEKYFPDFKNKEIARKVKLNHLLTHTSGLPDNRRSLLDSVYLLTAKDEENFAPIKQNDSLLFEPGSRYEYSNPAFNALALIIEKIEGKKWQTVVQERIFNKAGMTSSLITDGAFPEKGVSHAYIKVHGQFLEKDYGEEPTFAAAGNGGVWSSTGELVKYEAAIREAKFLDAKTIERSRTITIYPNWKDSQPAFIGYSWFISQPGDSVKIVSHTGSQGGFSSDFVSIPEKGITYVILCNKPMPILELRKEVMVILSKNNWLNAK